MLAAHFYADHTVANNPFGVTLWMFVTVARPPVILPSCVTCQSNTPIVFRNEHFCIVSLVGDSLRIHPFDFEETLMLLFNEFIHIRTATELPFASETAKVDSCLELFNSILSFVFPPARV